MSQLFVDVMSQLRIKSGRLQRKIRPTPDTSTVHFLFDRFAYFTLLEEKNPYAKKEILFDGYLMGSIFAVQKDTLLQSSPAHEKARNLGRSQAFLPPPSGYAAVQWFEQTLADVSRLRKTFFPSFLFDGKPSGPATKPKNPCATKEILFDGDLMERLKLLSLRPDLFLPAYL